MASDRADRTSPSWHNLPAKIRQTILNALLQTDGSLAPYATVSREWQAVIEPHNFSRLKLTIPRIQQLDSMTFRTQRYVQYIWLCLELEEYELEEYYPQGMGDADSHAIGKALYEVVDALSSWCDRPNLVLDISIHSPSDSAYWFKYLTFEPDCPFNQRESEYSELPGLSVPAITNCGSDDSDEIEESDDSDDSPDLETDDDAIYFTSYQINKVFNQIVVKGPVETTMEGHEWWQGMPLARAVTAVLFRQQTRRRWPPKTMMQLLSRFPRLREIHYEPWREWDDGMQKRTDGDYQILFHSVASSPLKKLTVFENFNQRYPIYFERCSDSRNLNYYVARAIARCLELEQLSASFIIDAKHFFQARGRDWEWLSLTTLVLTSGLLQPLGDHSTIQHLLFQAARAALRMPKLELMEIWNGLEGVAAVFRYQTPRYKANREGKPRPTVMTWRGTWKFKLLVTLIQSWEHVTNKLHGDELVVKTESLSGRLIASHADAIHHLGIAELAIRPVSQRQIRAEHLAGEEAALVAESSADSGSPDASS
ncbi:hypothetical protein TGAM01_v208720 [Trichoderma gamsii]|uniref:DUF6546 domain-containing protein n=1 Tax=Trichoderma gamsii TaxID=398673 RepID=A0A2P4ZDS6_9HYPO|nr:hypothetical protein TGAM01_v208720 [Trichoderma gamsii]PON22439.1 hypothetical protein TGAM01_v208720 [Trichoderma gamsii]